MQIRIKAYVYGRFKNIDGYSCYELYELSHSEIIGSLLPLMRIY